MRKVFPIITKIVRPDSLLGREAMSEMRRLGSVAPGVTIYVSSAVPPRARRWLVARAAAEALGMNVANDWRPVQIAAGT